MIKARSSEKSAIVDELIVDLVKLKNPAKAKILAGFFKTGEGEYGAGDIFWGLTAEQIKRVAKKYQDVISLPGVAVLLSSKVHEQRVCAMRILVYAYEKFDKLSDERGRKRIFDFYLKHTGGINNWDLVDLSASQIVGGYLLDKDKRILYRLARSEDLWERRIAILATFWFIRNGKYADTLAIAEILLADKHDLIHKAVGWMLREVGKRDKKTEINFLEKHAARMPRTMLRYAIEKFPPAERKRWLRRDKVASQDRYIRLRNS